KSNLSLSIGRNSHTPLPPPEPLPGPGSEGRFKASFAVFSKLRATPSRRLNLAVKQQGTASGGMDERIVPFADMAERTHQVMSTGRRRRTALVAVVLLLGCLALLVHQRVEIVAWLGDSQERLSAWVDARPLAGGLAYVVATAIGTMTPVPVGLAMLLI